MKEPKMDEVSKMDEVFTPLPVPSGQLFKWNIGMCVFHAVFGITALAISKLGLRVPLYASDLDIVTMDGDEDAWAFGPELPKRVGWLHLSWAVASFSWLSAIFHCGNAFIWRKYYVKALEQAYSPFRWIEYSVSASVMILILSYVSGTVFRDTIILLFALTFVTMTFGHLHEVICRPKNHDEWAESNVFWRLQAHLFGYIPQVFTWAIVIANFISAAKASTVDSLGEERKMPAFVYGIVFGELVIFWSFGVVQLVVSLRPPSNYYQGEIAYMWLSLIAKGLLALLCLTNVIMAGGYAEIYEQVGSRGD